MGYAGMKWFHWIVCFIAGLGALHVGLVALDYNFLATPAIAQYALIIQYIFGAAGLASLISLFLGCYSCSCKR